MPRVCDSGFDSKDAVMRCSNGLKSDGDVVEYFLDSGASSSSLG